MAGWGFSPDVDEAISSAESSSGLPPGFMGTFARIESGGDPRNRTGSYRGLFQLGPDEWKQYGQGDIHDPKANATAAAAKFSADSGRFKSAYGRDPTADELYMIHQQGWGGASAHWDNPDAPAWQNMHGTGEGRAKGPEWAKRAIWGNVPTDVRGQYGSVDNMTSRDFTNLWANKVARLGGPAASTAGGQPMARDYDRWNMVGPGEDELLNPPPAGLGGGGMTPRGMPQMQQQAEAPSFLQSLNHRLNAPMTQQGLGLFLAASQGKDLNEGMSAGLNRSKSYQDQWAQEIDMRRKQAVQQGVQKLFQSGKFGELPPGLAEYTAMTGDPSQAFAFMAKHPEMQLERQKMALANRKMDAEIEAGRKPQVVGGNLVQMGPGGKAKVVYNGEDQSTQRRAQVEAAGLDPDNPSSKVFIATGKMPNEDQKLTATDKKAILESDEAVSKGDGVIQKLEEALRLSPQAYSGPFASTRGYVGSLVGLEAGKATESMDNIITSGSLENLKAIFGGNPTEGERKILLDIQGSSNKAPAVREEIFRNALAAAKRRQEFNRQRAQEMRGGTYYKPPGAAGAQPPAAGTPSPGAPTQRLRLNPQTGQLDPVAN